MLFDRLNLTVPDFYVFCLSRITEQPWVPCFYSQMPCISSISQLQWGRIAIQLLWFLFLVCVFWKVSCRCFKKLSYQGTDVCWMERYMSSGKYFRPLKKGEKNSTAPWFCVFLALFRYPHAHYFPPLKTHFWTVEERKKKNVKKVIMGILLEFLISFLELVPLSKSCVSFLVTWSWCMRTCNHWLVVFPVTSSSEWSNTLQPCWKYNFKCFVHL